MQRIFYLFCLSYLAIQIGFSVSCKHDPTFDPENMMPGDTTTMDTTTMDTTVVTNPCDPDVVYFNAQILPILQSNCAFSGCHDPATASDGVILETYEDVIATADVEPFDLSGSDLYEVITETDPDKRMPQPPNSPLTSDQIQLIAKWILQGAENLECEETGGCDTDNISFSADVRPVIQTYCQGCHGGSAPSGGINLTTHSGVAAVANNGRLYGAINRDNGFSPMPQGAAKLPACTIAKIKSWIDAGAPNN